MKIVLIAIAALVILYIADVLAVHLTSQPYGEVQIRRYYAMPLKGGRTEYGDAGVEKETCVHSLLPHSGDTPCWYANRHKEKWVTE